MKNALEYSKKHGIAIITILLFIILALTTDGFFSERNLTEARIGIKVNGTLSWRSCFSCDVPVMKEFKKLKTFSL